ncbi:MAG: 50S ribosomal protein L24 [Thermoplasmata archaeon]
MPTTSKQPRRQRKAFYTADGAERRRRMTVPLSRDLRGRFKRRHVPVRKGDTVRVLSGSFLGREERVAKVSRRHYSVTLDNITVKTGDQKLKPLPIQLSHLVITRLNLSDPWRRRSLRVADTELTEEELAPPTPPEVAELTPAKEAEPSPLADAETTEPAEESTEPEKEEETSPSAKRQRTKPATEEGA